MHSCLLTENSITRILKFLTLIHAHLKTVKVCVHVVCEYVSVHVAFSSSTAAMEEENDCLMEDAILYLQRNRYRDGCSKNEKRIIRRKATRFTLNNGELIYTKKDKMKVCFSHSYTCSF